MRKSTKRSPRFRTWSFAACNQSPKPSSTTSTVSNSTASTFYLMKTSNLGWLKSTQALVWPPTLLKITTVNWGSSRTLSQHLTKRKFSRETKIRSEALTWLCEEIRCGLTPRQATVLSWAVRIIDRSNWRNLPNKWRNVWQFNINKK